MGIVRHWLGGRAGKLAAGVGASLAVVAAFYAAWSYLSDGTPGEARYSMFICTETGKAFKHKNELGEVHPIRSPYSGKNTGVLAEPCFWTADGRAKVEATWVLLNEAVGRREATFCPDCGRLVVGHNPPPGPGSKAPPTRGEYAVAQASRQSARASRDDR